MGTPFPRLAPSLVWDEYGKLFYNSGREWDRGRGAPLPKPVSLPFLCVTVLILTIS